MADSSPTIEKARELLRQRREELSGELEQIDQALSSLGERPTPAKRGPGRPRRSSSRAKKQGGSKRQRSRRGGTRSEHALKLVGSQPGMSASEIAAELKIKPNYVYRVMGELVEDGKVEKRGKGYFPRTGQTSPEPANEPPAPPSGDAAPAPDDATPEEVADAHQLLERTES